MPVVHVRFIDNGKCSTAQLVGSFNSWIPANMQREGNSWVHVVVLSPGTYQFKFVADGVWIHDPAQTTVTDADGNVNNVLHIEDHSKDDAYVLAIDQGTQSTRVIVYNRQKKPLVQHQEPLANITPKPGWVEQDPLAILETTKSCLRRIIEKAKGIGIELDSRTLKAVGITNQRETTILWDGTTGKPLYNAIVWNDLRTESIVEVFVKKYGKDHFRSICGLPLSTYFSALKIRWLIDNVPEVREAIDSGKCKFGTVDTWLIWNLSGGVHVTDVTNASRTMLLNLTSLTWDNDALRAFDIPKSILPSVKSSAEIYGNFLFNTEISHLSLLHNVPISGCVGDQQAALIGQHCFSPGDVKSTCGTGCFLLINTGKKLVESTSGLLTTIGYKLGAFSPVVYALEGSIAIAGACVSWFQSNLGIINSPNEISSLAASVDSNGGVYFVPALSGLFAPHWRPDARGVILGLTLHSSKAHIARALLEAIAFQTKDILDSAKKDSHIVLEKLMVDGGLVQSDILLQILADVTNLTVVRPSDKETTALGAAIAAGVGVGLWPVPENSNASTENFRPKLESDRRDRMIASWNNAVKLSYAHY